MIVHRHSLDLDAAGNPLQAGCRIIVDGEARAEAWEPCGPFHPEDQAERLACQVASDLYERQIPGQLRLV